MKYYRFWVNYLMFALIIISLLNPLTFGIPMYNDNVYKWVLMLFIPIDNHYTMNYNVSYAGKILDEIGNLLDLSNKLKIIIFLDTYDDSCKIYSVETGNNGVRLEQQLDLGECNTGDPRVLNYFINYTISRYKGEYYGLFIIDRSNAWIGEFKHIHFIALDEHIDVTNGKIDGTDYLCFNELVDVLSKYNVINLLFFDVDHYLSLDLYLELSTKTSIDYVVGTPLTIHELRYDVLFKELSSTINEALPKDLAKLIVDIAGKYGKGRQGFVISAFKLNIITKSFTSFLREIMNLLYVYPEKTIKLLDFATRNSVSYFIPSYYSGRVFVDLGVFIREIQYHMDSFELYDEELSSITSELYGELIAARIAYASHSVFNNSIGLSLYFPRDPCIYLRSRVWYIHVIDNIGSLLWSDLINTYYSIKDPDIRINIKALALPINNTIHSLITMMIRGKPVDPEIITITVYQLTNSSLRPINVINDVTRVNEGAYIADLRLSSNASTNVVVKIDVSLGFIRTVYYYSLNSIYYNNFFTEYLRLLDARITSINGNIVLLNTLIGRIETTVDDVLQDIKLINKTVVKILFKTNETLYGRISSIEGDIATIRTGMGELYINLAKFKNDISDQIRFMGDDAVKRINLVHYILSFIIIEIGLIYYVISAKRIFR